MEPMEKCRMEREPIQMGRYDGAGGSLFRIENTFQEVGSQCLFLNGLFPWMASRFAERRLSNDDCG